jgi:hypothetical protein
MVRRAAVVLVLTVAAFGGLGCFAVSTTDTAYLIDDFDDGRYQPSDPNFSPWGCYLVNAESGDAINQYNCQLGPGDRSLYALTLDFTVHDPANGISDDVGAGLHTTARSPEDLTAFQQLVFSVLLTSGSPQLPMTAKFYVYLGCSTAVADDGSVPGDLAVVYSESAGSTWRTWQAYLSDFSSPSWSAIHIQGGTAACLERVDSIQFEVDAALADGASGAGTLSIDDIYLQ